ncbi:MAG: S41 family peptidase [Firmicutes bacterium]|nr:S41 family peptidase [Bacillota bacterium]
MKKLLLSIILILALNACSNEHTQNISEPITENYEIITETIDNEIEENTILNRLSANQNIEISIEAALQDVNFIVQTLEDNFPFLGVTARITGNDNPIDAFKNSLTLSLQNLQNDNITTEEFENVLRQGFNENFVASLAHLNLSRAGIIMVPEENFTVPQGTNSHIIEEEKIALLTIPQQLYDETALPMREIQEFIAKIQGYEHIILDLRYVVGGFLETPISTLISPNISEPLILQEYAFITNGEMAQTAYNRELSITQTTNANRRNNNTFVLRDIVEESILPAADFAELHNLTEINQQDLDNLAYGFLLETSIPPIDTTLRLPLLAENIWLLVGENNFSAASITAQIAKEAGFILVGETTNRANSWARSFFFLPNSRHSLSMDTFYITDNTGRNTEEFPIEPHYFNRPGMDALQTTLAIIAEREE